MASCNRSQKVDIRCCPFTKLHLAPGPTLSNRCRHECSRMLQTAARAIVREPTQIITDTKGQFEDCGESEEEALLLVAHFRRMKISVRNLNELPRICRRSTL